VAGRGAAYRGHRKQVSKIHFLFVWSYAADGLIKISEGPKLGVF
jgi:hypothetical protein